ncbi:hypothetical protein CYMTET_22825 [Cymbomonas tetramitiformis]|uniref:Reverse transcriptase domain-containing protein n=1 Tax=Cymbomonas tetramitiformis TaxID=36881 RepID=A0AAE0L1W7_9CHLO|nr:hypothetical protein CYMTET_22825 [Cymbomonas tetramitiformis]
MDYELRAFTHCTVAYVDDVVIYSDTAEQHLKDVEAVLRTLGDAGIRLHSGKSTVGAATVDFLGYRIGDPPRGVETNPEAHVANHCQRLVKEQLGTGEVHRLFDLHYQEELECNRGIMFDTDHPEVAGCSGRLTRAAWDALSQVQPVRGMHSGGSPAVYSNDTMKNGKLKVPKKIDTRLIDKSFFQEAREEGVVCYEPGGGLCAGLEMLLRCGAKVKKYLYQDISTASQAVARTRCLALSRRHPDLLPAAAIHLEQLPASNLEDTRLKDLVRAGALSGDREVNLDEKVIAMGYSASELRMTGGMSDEELAGILGLAMDRRAMGLLFAVAEASTMRLPKSEESQEEQGALTAIPVAGPAERPHMAARYQKIWHST